MLSVLEQNNISKVLARPTLSRSRASRRNSSAAARFHPGRPASNRITIDFKEYGVKLVFVPTVLANEVVDSASTSRSPTSIHRRPSR